MPRPVSPPAPPPRSPAPPNRHASPPKLAATPMPRPQVRGPFFVVDGRKLRVRAVTYGTFASNADGDLFPDRDTVRADLRGIAGLGANAIRTYTPPPPWLLEEARDAGLRVLVGIHWEAQSCDLDDPAKVAEAEHAVREAVRGCAADRDVVLAYVIGNEVPQLVARFHGPRRVETVLRRLRDAAKAEDPQGLVTYGNYPTTEYLRLDFLDFLTFNVYLLDRQRLAAYLDRLLVTAHGKPVLLGEVGDDSLRKGELSQARLLDWTIALAFERGLAGVCVFAWTDDWVVGGERVDGWCFGIVDADRRPKAAAAVVERQFHARLTALADRRWPRVSVVVCNYNGAATLDETLRSLCALRYPDFEIVYVDDGSTDDSLAIARRYASRIRIIAQDNCGLSVARNVGAEAATGEIVAYTDSDAFADPDWLTHLVVTMVEHGLDAAGGPNLTPESDGFVAQLIAACPGNPTYVLRDNVRADHIAGVNMAFRRDALLEVGGFDPVHRRAGDDVDICWRFDDAGKRIGFSPAAIVWHHRRPSIRRYLKQQYGYGEAENQLEIKHPERFNVGGYIRWNGRVYVAPRRALGCFAPFVYHGKLGEALFQSMYQHEPSHLLDGPGMVQWYLVWIALFAVAPLWPWALPVAVAMAGMSVWRALLIGMTTQVDVETRGLQRLHKVALVAAMWFAHPLVRWWGRVHHRARAVRPVEQMLRTRWLKPLPLLREVGHLVRRRRERRSYWGLHGAQRAALVAGVLRELKRQRTSATPGREWDAHDLTLDAYIVSRGLLFTAPEHYDQALCFGFEARLTGIARSALLCLAAVALLASLQDPRALVLWALPVALFVYCLGCLARLRQKTWGAVDHLARELSGVPFDRRRAAPPAPGPRASAS